jgi:hypothetical protein
MNKLAVGAIMLLFAPAALEAQLFTDPATNIGEKNLYVGAEYSSIMSEYDLDASNVPIISRRALIKVTAGLTDRIDVWVKGGGVGLRLDYKQNDDNVTKNFDPSNMKPGFGAGTRIQLRNFEDSGTRVFFEGGGFYFTADDNIEWSYPGKTKQDNRSMRWLDLFAGIGVAKRIDFVDVNCGIGLTEIRWWMQDDTSEKVGSVTSTVKNPWRDSFEWKNPVLGFFGIDFVLPQEYRISVQAGIRSMNDAAITVSLSQGLDKK